MGVDASPGKFELSRFFCIICSIPPPVNTFSPESRASFALKSRIPKKVLGTLLVSTRFSVIYKYNATLKS